MKPYQLYLFDWDGCLADTLSIWLRGYIKTFSDFNLNPSEKTIIGKVFGDWDGPSKLGIKDGQGFTQQLLDDINPKLEQPPLHARVYETLSKLRLLDKQLGLISSSAKNTIQKAVKHHNLSQFFREIICAEDVAKHKPDPEGIHKIMTHLQCDSNNSVIIGDSEKDIMAGKNAGIDTIVFYPKENHKFYSLNTLKALAPTHIISDLPQLLNT